MWSELPSLCPLWHLLAPSTLPFPRQGLSNRYIDTVSSGTPWQIAQCLTQIFQIVSAKQYEDPALWTRFLRFASLVRCLTTRQADFLHERDLVRAVLDRNGGESIFSSLRQLYWAPGSSINVAAFQALLLTPALRIITIRTPEPFMVLKGTYVVEGFIVSLGGSGRSMPTEDETLDSFFKELTTSPLHIDTLHIEGHLPKPYLLRSLRSSKPHAHLRTVRFSQNVGTFYMSTFLAVAGSLHMQSLVINGSTFSDFIERTVTKGSCVAPVLEYLKVHSDCTALETIFTALDAPSLRSAVLDVGDLGGFQVVPSSHIKAFAGAVSSSSFTDLDLKLRQSGDSLNGFSLFYSKRPVSIQLRSLVEPIFPLHNMQVFSLTGCTKIRLRVDDEVLRDITQAWPNLVRFSLVGILQGGTTERSGEKAADPTIRALYYFWRNCPNLRKLVLPPLSFPDSFRDLPVPLERSTHELSVLQVAKVETWSQKSLRAGATIREGEAENFSLVNGYIRQLFPTVQLVDGSRHVYH